MYAYSCGDPAAWMPLQAGGLTPHLSVKRALNMYMLSVTCHCLAIASRFLQMCFPMLSRASCRKPWGESPEVRMAAEIVGYQLLQIVTLSPQPAVGH